MKKHILILVILVVLVGTFPTNIHAMGMKENPNIQEQQIVPFAAGDTLVKKYRVYRGKTQSRWWNQTKGCWAAGSTWKNV